MGNSGHDFDAVQDTGRSQSKLPGGRFQLRVRVSTSENFALKCATRNICVAKCLTAWAKPVSIVELALLLFDVHEA
jgi:hypothetical protein